MRHRRMIVMVENVIRHCELAEAEARRARNFASFAAAMRFADLVRQEDAA